MGDSRHPFAAVYSPSSYVVPFSTAWYPAFASCILITQPQVIDGPFTDYARWQLTITGVGVVNPTTIYNVDDTWLMLQHAGAEFNAVTNLKYSAGMPPWKSANLRELPSFDLPVPHPSALLAPNPAELPRPPDRFLAKNLNA